MMGFRTTRLVFLIRPIVLAGAALSLSACSYIGSIFPDKQKQYRYSSELPDLEVPPDLTSPTAEEGDEDVKPASRFRGEANEKSAGGDDISDKAAKNRSSESESESGGKASAKKRKPSKHEGPSATLAETSDNAALIELEEPFPEAWNDVSRALGRLKVEISDQNRSDGVFFVYYGGVPPKKADDTSFWEDVSSMFSSERDQAREYQVKLEDKENYTLIKILDQDGQTVSEGPGLDLLKGIHKKLLTLDQPEPEGKDAKGGEASEKKD